jgi:replicative DNA helicase
MDQNQLNFSIDFHYSVIKLMLKDETFALKCLEYLSADLFKGTFTPWAFTKISNYYQKYNTIPSVQFLLDQLKTVNEMSQAEFKREFSLMAKSNIHDSQYIKDEMTKFIKYRLFLKMYDNVSKNFAEQKYEDSYDLVDTGIEKIKQVKFERDDYVTSEEALGILNRSKEEDESQKIPTGLSLLDKELKGGLDKKTVTTVMGGYNVGKTIAAINIACNALKAGKTVLFLFHEGHKDNIVKQIIACYTGLRLRTIEYGNYVDHPTNLAKVKQATELFNSKLRLKEYADLDKMSVEDVASYAKIAAQEMGSLDLIVDDYAGILTSKTHKHKELRHNMARVWQILGLLSKTLDVAIVTIAQFNRDAVIKNKEGNQILRSSNVGEAIGIAQHSDTILTLNRSFEDEDDQKIIVCLDKTRQGRAGKLIECNTDYEAATLWNEAAGIYDKGWDLGVVKRKKAENEE